MSIRLNKVARDLNVGIQTAVEFLQKKGFTVEANPNTKITDEQYALLVKEFSKDKNLKLESESISLERHKEKSKATSATESEEGNSSSAIKEEPKEPENNYSRDTTPESGRSNESRRFESSEVVRT